MVLCANCYSRPDHLSRIDWSFSVARYLLSKEFHMEPLKMKIAAGVLAATVAGLTGRGWALQQGPGAKPAESATGQTLAGAGEPAQKTERSSKLDLTPETFAKFRDLVRPAANEWRHLKVKWFTDIVVARKKAAQEDKPILVFRTGGAGYNDPLGVC
jgi:hypothetical protein